MSKDSLRATVLAGANDGHDSRATETAEHGAHEDVRRHREPEREPVQRRVAVVVRGGILLPLVFGSEDPHIA